MRTGNPSEMATTRGSKRRPKSASIRLRTPVDNGVTIADLLKRLGNISASRVRLYPAPGTATEKDVIKVLDRENRPCELVDGTLVEKPMGYEESEIAATIIILVGSFVRRHKLGIVTGPDGSIRLFPGLVRIPDVAFASWDCFPGRKRPRAPIPQLAPDLVVEVLSKSNTKGEMNRKLREYFEAGVRLMWMVQPKKRAVRVYTAVDKSVLLVEDQSLDGGAVLPGFVMLVNELFVKNEP
jgi:Uma2 family endonuclease